MASITTEKSRSVHYPSEDTHPIVVFREIDAPRTDESGRSAETRARIGVLLEALKDFSASSAFSAVKRRALSHTRHADRPVDGA